MNDFMDDHDEDDFGDDGDYADDDFDDPLGIDKDDWDEGYCEESEPDSDGDFDDESGDDDFSLKEAFFLGGAMGWAYEEGLRKRRRRKRVKGGNDGTS